MEGPSSAAEAQWKQGPRRWCFFELLRRRIDRIRQSVRHQTRWTHRDPVRSRKFGDGIPLDVHRVVAEVLGVPWEKCDVTWGNTSKNLPWTCVSGGSQTTHAMTRAAHAAAMDGKQKLQEIAAKTLGGKPDQYEVSNERVYRKGGRGMTLAQAAQHAIQLGGKYDGHEPPDDVNKVTKASIAALAGQGLVAAAKDKYPRDGQSFSYVASFAEVEVDIETGKYEITDFLAVADVGTVIHP